MMLVTIPGAALAQRAVAPHRVIVKEPPFREWQPQFVGYSGEELVGVVAGDIRASQVGKSIVVSGISNADALICVDIEQSNGGYRASFTIPNPRQGSTVQFLMPSRLLGTLRARAGELAVRARAGVRSCSPASPVLATSWGNAGGGGISLLVNSMRADRVSVAFEGKRSVCRPLKTAIGDDRVSITSFDTVCPLATAGRCGAQSEVVVQFMDGNEFRDRPLNATLRAPCR